MNPRTEPPALCPLDAYRLALELIALLAPKMKKLDADTRRQLREALNSVVLNTAEAWGRRGQDRTFHFSVAYASALEAGAAIEAARAWGQLGDCLEERTLAGRIAATLRRPAGWLPLPPRIEVTRELAQARARTASAAPVSAPVSLSDSAPVSVSDSVSVSVSASASASAPRQRFNR